jgi:hypothetical protein
MSPPVPSLKLYEIANDYLQALNTLTTQADAEGVLPDDLCEALNQLEGTFEAKAVNVAAYIRSLESESAAICEVKKTMERRMTSLSNQAGRLRDYLKMEMEKTGILNVSHPWLTVRVQSNPPSVIVDDAVELPDCFKEKIENLRLLKMEISNALKSGQDVPGAHLANSTRLVIT